MDQTRGRTTERVRPLLSRGETPVVTGLHRVPPWTACRRRSGEADRTTPRQFSAPLSMPTKLDLDRRRWRDDGESVRSDGAQTLPEISLQRSVGTRVLTVPRSCTTKPFCRRSVSAFRCAFSTASTRRTGDACERRR
jgi:hypothetical protein